MKPKVVIVGSYVHDLVWNCDRFPNGGESRFGTFHSGPGGKGSNQAVAAARAGAPTLFIGAVGRDLFGDAARQFYQTEGIRGHFIVKPGHPTATAGIFVNREAENKIVVALGANAALRPRDIDPALLRGAQTVICQHETSPGVNSRAFHLARQAGALTVLNPAPMRDDFAPAQLRDVDVLIPNESEFVAMVNRIPSTGRTDFSAAELDTMPVAELHRLCGKFGVPAVIITLGKRGCLVSRAEGHEFIPAFIVRPVDTTGAGDAFIGGFAAGLLRHKGDLLAAARHGNAVAALSVTKPGTASSMPTQRRIAAFLRAAKVS